MKNFTQTSVHHALESLSKGLPHLRQLISDSDRAAYLQIKSDDVLVDFSYQRITPEIIDYFDVMLSELQFDEWKRNYFSGAKINNTEHRAVLHTALRAMPDQIVMVDGANVVDVVQKTRRDMYQMADVIRADVAIKNVICIGIGGSDLGPRFVYDAFQEDRTGPKLHFVSNVDGLDLYRVLNQSDPSNSIVIIASKTFTTTETMINADTVRAWFGGAIDRFYAVTASPHNARAWGVLSDQILPFEDWVGGRFSLWSTIGFGLVIAFGSEFFDELLSGAHAADNDFYSKPLRENIAAMMGVIGVWNRNYLGCPTHLMAPYDGRLRLIAKYIQQMDMESNGKSIDRDGHIVSYQTSPHLYGESGTDCQHSYMQLIHQGTTPAPVDFIAVQEPRHNLPPIHHKTLLANMRAQVRALALGQTLDEAEGDAFRVFSGNRPSSVFMLKCLNPYILGYLIALYEHKIFTQGILWNLNSYDQPGVELGKIMAKQEMV